MHLSKSSKAALIATALMSLPSAAAAAQSGVDQTRTTTTTQQREEDRDFPWGLLGLLGLAGLLGLRRGKERDIHVDARRDHDNRPRP